VVLVIVILIIVAILVLMVLMKKKRMKAEESVMVPPVEGVTPVQGGGAMYSGGGLEGYALPPVEPMGAEPGASGAPQLAATGVGAIPGLAGSGEGQLQLPPTAGGPDVGNGDVVTDGEPPVGSNVPADGVSGPPADIPRSTYTPWPQIIIIQEITWMDEEADDHMMEGPNRTPRTPVYDEGGDHFPYLKSASGAAFELLGSISLFVVIVTFTLLLTSSMTVAVDGDAAGIAVGFDPVTLLGMSLLFFMTYLMSVEWDGMKHGEVHQTPPKPEEARRPIKSPDRRSFENGQYMGPGEVPPASLLSLKTQPDLIYVSRVVCLG
jgi:hypothetical protein